MPRYIIAEAVMEIARFVTTTAGTKDSLQDARTTINDHFQRPFVGDECYPQTRLMHGRSKREREREPKGGREGERESERERVKGCRKGGWKESVTCTRDVI